MSVKDFPDRPQGSKPEDFVFLQWLDKLSARQNIDLLQVASSLPSGAKVPIFDPTETGQNKTKAIDASLLGGGGGVNANILINGGFQVNQEAPASNADDTYAHDQWYVLTQSNAIAVSTLSAVENGLPLMARLTQSNASAQRMGYAQIIEGKYCKQYRGQSVTFKIGRTRLSSSANIRFAVLEWTGTEDTVTSDVVNDWTSSTYTAGNFFLGSNLTVSGVSSQALTANTLTDGSVLTVTLGSSFNNLIVFAWTEGTVAQNVTFDLGKVKLENASSATDFICPPLTETQILCFRYLEAIGGVAGRYGVGRSVSTSISEIYYPWKVKKRATPAISLATFSHWDLNDASVNIAFSSFGTDSSNADCMYINVNAAASTLTAFRQTFFAANNTTPIFGKCQL